MKKKFTSLLLAGLLTLSLITGCGDSEDTTTEATTQAVTEAATEEATEAEATEAEAASAGEAEGTSTKDRSGNNIVIPAKVEKIVSLAPSTTRFLIDLGLADKIIAIDTNSYAYTDSLAADIPQFDMMAPDNEALVALEPDIIFTSGMSNVGGDDVYQSARDAGICVADIPSSSSFKDIADDLEFIASAVGEEEKGAEIIDSFNSKIDEIKKIGSGISEKKTVLFELSLPTSEYPSIYTLGSGTYLDEMITDIGAENITGDQEGWLNITEEEAIAMNPDVIITNVNYVEDAVGDITSNEAWKNVNAVKNSQVFYIDADSSNQPNDHVVDAMIQMAKYIYPDEYADFEDPF